MNALLQTAAGELAPLVCVDRIEETADAATFVFQAPDAKPLVSGSKHPKCKGWYKNNWGSMDGPEWGCDYEPDFGCEDCKYGLGDKDPER